MGQKTNPASLRLRNHYQINGVAPTSIIILRNNITDFFTKKGFYVNHIRISEQNENLQLNISFFFSHQNKILAKHARRALIKRSRLLYLKNNEVKNNKRKKSNPFLSVVFPNCFKKKLFKQRFLKCESLKLDNNISTKTIHSEILNGRNLFSSLLKKKISGYNTIFFSLDRCLPNRKLKKIQQFWRVFKIYVSFQYRKKIFVNDLFWAAACLLEKKISAALLNALIVKAFKRLPKKEHRSFFFFLKNMFSAVLSADNKSYLRGFKLQVSGRFGGKPRSKVQEFTIGQVACQTFSLPLDYSCLNSCTTLGSFGFKLFITKNYVI